MMQASMAVRSGPGTSMLSRTGASTIMANKVFQNEHDNIEDFIHGVKNARKYHATSLSGPQEDSEPEHYTKLPKIAENPGG